MPKVRPYVASIDHALDCPRRVGKKHGSRPCPPACKRTTSGWDVDIRVRLPNGEVVRERHRSTLSKTGATDWGRARESLILREGTTEKKKVAPTLSEFWPDFVKLHVEANKQKHSTKVTNESIYRVHLKPAFGSLRLDAISSEDIQKFKAGLAKRAPKTVNNILALLSKVMNVAVDYERIPRIACRFQLMKVQDSELEFYEKEDFERLLEGAKKADPRTYIVALLGGDAGLRIGEIIGLEWTDLHLRRRQMTIQRSGWQGVVGSPKGGKSRVVPMTGRLATALKDQRGLRTRVLTKDDGTDIDWDLAREKMKTAQRRAGMVDDGALHKLRHTFGARCAMAGIPATTIQRLMGHADLKTTLRYLHLAPTHLEGAIRALEFGDILETGPSTSRLVNGIVMKNPATGTTVTGHCVTPTGLEPMFSA
ncbi:MAG: tyrosine-type recombinase/integrase [Deltaproteobacteria bacterium]